MSLLHALCMFMAPAPVEAQTAPPVPAVAITAPATQTAPPAPAITGPAVDPAARQDWSRLRARQRLGRRLAAGGFAGLGAAYVGNLVAGIGSGALGEDPTSIVGLIPVVGPFAFAGFEGGRPGWQTFFVLDGLAQVGLLATGIGGVVIAKRSRRALARPRFQALEAELAGRLDSEPDLVRRGRLGAGLAAGFGGFGLAHVLMGAAFLSADTEKLVTSKTDVQRGWAWVPLAGPFVVAAQADLAGTKALAAVLGVIQVGSLATGITGAVIRGRRMRDAESRVVRDVTVAPWHGAMTTGLMIRGRF